jgi:hypothetical protein
LVEILTRKKTRGRQLKRKISELLRRDDVEKSIAEICRLPARQVVNPLFQLLCSVDEKIKWNSVTAMGAVVSSLAEQDLESARIVMRRCMWNLNDESGGIGWGCPEAMGEAMARNQKLAEEYWCILLSYIQPDGNFLEHEILQRGALWGVGRLAHTRPKLLECAAPFLYPFIQSDDVNLRGLAVWAIGPLVERKTMSLLKALSNDNSRLKLYREGYIAQYSVGQLAQEALAASKHDTLELMHS